MNILLLLYQLSLFYTICSSDCGASGRQDVVEDRDLKERYEEGEGIYYKCKRGYKIVDSTDRRKCVRGRWSGEVPRCGEFDQCDGE